MGIHCPLYTFLVEYNIRLGIIITFQVGKGILARKLKIFRVFFSIFGVALLLVGLDSTLVESQRNKNITPLPTSLDNTMMKLLSSPLCVGS